jgi:hypothetical protein
MMFFIMLKTIKINVFFLGYPGLEPGTNRLKAEYSTIELATLDFN